MSNTIMYNPPEMVDNNRTFFIFKDFYTIIKAFSRTIRKVEPRDFLSIRMTSRS